MGLPDSCSSMNSRQNRNRFSCNQFSLPFRRATLDSVHRRDPLPIKNMAEVTFDKDAFWERAKLLLANIKVCARVKKSSAIRNALTPLHLLCRMFRARFPA